VVVGEQVRGLAFGVGRVVADVRVALRTRPVPSEAAIII
jgi:hypothetical protein